MDLEILNANFSIRKRKSIKFTAMVSILWVSASLLNPFTVSGQKEVLIAAAADLRFAMDSILYAYRTDHPNVQIKISYGSSGNFFEQISNGAPYDLFFSADMDYARKLEEDHKTVSAVKLYGTGQLVLWSKKTDPNINGMNTLLDNSVVKIALANPAHAPYGKRAVESLQYYKIYEKTKGKLVFGENISQTAQFVTTGAADIGIIALALARAPNMQQQGGRYWVIPAESHLPLEQGYVILQRAKDNEAAIQFSSFIGSPKGKSILKAFGFGE